MTVEGFADFYNMSADAATRLLGLGKVTHDGIVAISKDGRYEVRYESLGEKGMHNYRVYLNDEPLINSRYSYATSNDEAWAKAYDHHITQLIDSV